jgi:hypothetical protein
MAWYEVTSKEYPIISEVYPNLQARVIVVALLYPRTLVGPILRESMPNPSLTRITLDQFLTMRYNTAAG